MSLKYILKGHTPIICRDLLQWAQWMETADRRVSKTMLGQTTVSTVFLGLDHSFGPSGTTPILFETMVFGGPLSDDQRRYTTWDEAVQGHNEMVEACKHAQTFGVGG